MNTFPRRPLGRLGLTCAALALGSVGLSPVAAREIIDPDTTYYPTYFADVDAELVAWASLPADTFADGPPSGREIAGPVNGRATPLPGQPVQGFSAVLDNEDGTFDVMSDNGFGAITNSADYHLRVYTIRPHFRTADGGSGEIEVVDFFELSDPNGHIPFAIVNHFTPERVLTGADFDIESFQQVADGTYWFGDEHGPFLLHTDESGTLLEAPIPLPDPDGDGELRAPENPFNEEISTLRTMNALRSHALANGNTLTPVVSPWSVMLADGTDVMDHPGRVAGSNDPAISADGLSAAVNSDIHDIDQLHAAGYDVVPYTVNDAGEMARLIELGVDGLISDRSDLLYEVVAAHDADGDGVGGDWLLDDGRIDTSAFDAQGHRGSRDLRPENTLPAMEVAIDNLMNTLEFDTGVSFTGQAMINHDPLISSEKCRHADGTPYDKAEEVLVRELSMSTIQTTFICDKVFRGESQTNDLALSPVSMAYASETGIHPYVMPSLDQVFEFVAYYEAWYSNGPGASDDDAVVKAANAASIRFNIETKINPAPESVDDTASPQDFVTSVVGSVTSAGIDARTSIQSFDWRTLLLVHEQYPHLQTVALFGDFPLGPGEAGTNLQDLDGENTPWLAGLFWPYRETVSSNPVSVPGSGGFEGMAMSPDGTRLYPMLEKPLIGSDERELLINEFDTRSGAYTGNTWIYPLNTKGAAIGDFVMFSPTRGLVIERDNSQGDLGGFKAIYEVRFPASGNTVLKYLALDLLDIADPHGLAQPSAAGDVGVGGNSFAFPFVTIEDVVVIDRDTIGVLNDNNYPFSVGRHLGDSGAGIDAQPDDNEFILVDLP